MRTIWAVCFLGVVMFIALYEKDGKSLNVESRLPDVDKLAANAWLN